MRVLYWQCDDFELNTELKAYQYYILYVPLDGCHRFSGGTEPPE